MSLAQREAIHGVLFASPWILGFLIFSLGPMIASFLLGFTEYNIAFSPRWIGVSNYVRAFTTDDLFWPALRKTFYYALVMVPIGIVASLFLAELLNQGLRGTVVYRILFFIPTLTPTVASTLLWAYLFDPSLGFINYVIWRLFHVEGPRWIYGQETAIPSLMIMALWSTIGGARMLIFLAALQGVPRELHDAVEIDGGGTWAKFAHVTLPMISPAIFFNLVLGIIDALKVFTAAFVATGGGPARATWFYALHVYQNAFRYYNMGYACALAWIFFAIIMVISMVQLRLSNSWVFYGGQLS